MSNLRDSMAVATRTTTRRNTRRFCYSRSWLTLEDGHAKRFHVLLDGAKVLRYSPRDLRGCKVADEAGVAIRCILRETTGKDERLPDIPTYAHRVHTWSGEHVRWRRCACAKVCSSKQFHRHLKYKRPLPLRVAPSTFLSRFFSIKW